MPAAHTLCDAVRPEFITHAIGTHAGIDDIAAVQPGVCQQAGVNPLQINEPFCAALLDKGLYARAHAVFHCLRYIGVGFKAALPDGRANDRKHGVPPCAERPCHGIDRVGQDARRRAAPSRMAHADALAGRVIQQRHHAVGIEPGERRIRQVGDNRVRLPRHRAVQPHAHGSLGHHRDLGAVHLLGTGDALLVHAERRAQDFIILPDVGRVVPAAETEVHAFARTG